MNFEQRNEYFTVREPNSFTFYRVPKVLFVDDKYKSVSTDAKCCMAYP